jgi:capsular exopolysaccharide synthesis family protein
MPDGRFPTDPAPGTPQMTMSSGAHPGLLGGYSVAARPFGAPGAGDAATHVSRLFFYLRRFWWIPVLTIAAALCAMAAFQAVRKPTFVSTARMTLVGSVRVPEGSVYSEEIQNFFGTQVELMRSTRLQQRAAERLNAQNPNLSDAPVEVTARQTPKASLFDLSVTSPDREYARAYLDALMDEYLDYRKEIRSDASDNTLATLSERVFEQEKDLKAAQEAFTEYQRDNNLAVLQQQSAAAASYLSRLTTQLSDLQLELNMIESEAVSTNDLEIAGHDALPRTANGALPPELQNARQQIEILKFERDELGRYLRPEHPKMQKLTDDITRAESMVTIYRDQTREQFTGLRESTRERVRNLQAAIQEWETTLNDANTRIAVAEKLKANVIRIEGLYERLSGLLQNVDVGKDLSSMNLNILERASPAIPAGPRTPRLIVFSGFIGLVIGLGLVFLVSRFDDRFTSLEEVARVFEEEILANIPNIAGFGNAKLPLVSDEGERPMFTEAYRSLRSTLMFQKFDGPQPRLLLVTSAIPGEGKSTIAANLACTLAHGGAKVLLIDADIRKGAQNATYGMSRDPGLTGFLQYPGGRGRPEEFIRPTTVPNLSLMASGALLKTHTEIFLGNVLDRLLEHAREHFDYTIMDSAPVFAVDDTPTIAPKVDGVVFVVRSDFSRVRAAQHALDILYQRQVKVLGLVVNRLNPRQRSYYYYKYADYYGSESDRSRSNGRSKQIEAVTLESSGDGRKTGKLS